MKTEIFEIVRVDKYGYENYEVNLVTYLNDEKSDNVVSGVSGCYKKDEVLNRFRISGEQFNSKLRK